MNITNKHFAYLVESTSSKNKQMPLPCDALSTKVKGCPRIALFAFGKAT
jgi:hypothetical protein